ncbi:glycosylphosphatidylinositol anchor attachment 1 protein [Anoplophora glabripennis]|nr:glycosylphosphatidylinositol anchor attachment 1 protein [Anoplophora glabripennis]
MGLLTDPSSGQGKLVKLLLKHYSKICVLLCLGGILWFCALACPQMNANTYFSENALLPGLVKSQFYEEKAASLFHDELIDEMKKYEDSIPYPWLLAKFKQLGLDTYTHNFTLHSPLSNKERYSGQNVYGILRAARASSTEALVLSVPYRPPSSVHASTSASVAVMLAFAKFANKEKYWAKDLIFLITEHEQLGIQAWLEAYHGVTCGNENVLDSGDLKGRGGAIQAAVNLEIHSTRIGQMDIKIEGLNGQLPNLDLFNLASKMCTKEGLYHTFKNKGPEYHRDPIKEWKYYFRNLLAMVATQATGIPNGNHGLFHRFGIQALTMEGFEQSKARGSSRVGFVSIGRIIEGTFRSLNNLLERFHQSFFFYLLSSPDRYISIGLYMPAVCLIAGALFIKSCAKWFKFQGSFEDESDKPKATEGRETESIKVDKVIILFLLTHFLGVVVMNIPHYTTRISNHYDYNVQTSIFYTLIGLSVIFLLLPFLVPFRSCERSMNAFNILAMLELGTALICISMNNFSLGMFCAVVSVPLALFMNPTSNRYYSFLQRILWLAVHPLTVLVVVVLVNTYSMFPTESFKEILSRGWDASQQAVIYSIVDSMIYGNWLFSVVTSIFIPNWLCFWCISCSNIKPKNVVSQDKKLN